MDDALGRRLHRLRTDRGLTQRELAEPKYTAAYVSSVESGRRTPSGDALRHFAHRLGVPEEELVTGRPADESVAMDLALVEAMFSDSGYAAVAETAGRLGDRRRRAWALLGLDTDAYLDEAARLLAGEPPPDRVPVVLARASRADARHAVYLLEDMRDELYRTGHPDPDARLALNAHLAERYLELGADDRAGAAAEEALALAGPGDPAGHLATARTLLAERRPADAAVALGLARSAYRRSALTPQLAACYRARGRQRRARGDLEAAAADLAYACDLCGGTVTALDIGVELAEVYRRRGRPVDARALLAVALTGFSPADAGADTGGDTGARAASGDASSSAKGRTASPSTAGAGAASGNAPAEAPLRVARARRELGLLALDNGDPAQAEDHLRAAAALYHQRRGPRHELAQTLRALGDLLVDQGRLAEATEVLRSGLLDLDEITRTR